MKFIFADSLDFIDPDYDFIEDVNGANRRLHEDDEFPHEYLRAAPYDGILVSRATVGNYLRNGKYTPAQAMRFSREGARAFYRYPASKFPSSIIMGDCGAFSYRDAAHPPYSVPDTLEFYQDGRFTHGCSVDHVIFEFGMSKRPPSARVRDRYELTLENARAFIKGAKSLSRFTPLGVVQGWSPASMAEAARNLCRMGYNYLAVGGMVPLRTPLIAKSLEAIRDAIPTGVKLHVLGFGKVDELGVLRRFGVASFDTTSPLKRAFLDAKKNYWTVSADGELAFYTAVRIPQAKSNDRLKRILRTGRIDEDRLIALEAEALEAVHMYALGRCSAGEAVDRVLDYDRYALWSSRLTEQGNERRVRSLRASYVHTLESRVWETCPCRVCKESGVHAIIFRSSNRNKRRGMHNLQVFYRKLRRPSGDA